MVTHAFVTPCSVGQARRGSYRPVVTVRLSEKAKQEQTEGGENNSKDSFKPEKRLARSFRPSVHPFGIPAWCGHFRCVGLHSLLSWEVGDACFRPCC